MRQPCILRPQAGRGPDAPRHRLHETEQVRTQANPPLPVDEGLPTVHISRAKTVRQARCRARVFPTGARRDSHIAKLFHGVMDDVSVCTVDSTELVIMQIENSPSMSCTMRNYSGLTISIITAQQLYYWPGMPSDIKTYIDACVPCQQARPPLARQKLLPPVSPSLALHPMRSVSLDLLAAARQDWLAMVDRYSGYAWTTRLSSTTTRHMLSHLETWFTDFDWPLVIRSDNGPQFRSEFSFFCQAHRITHELASPYNPESNGLAETAVKNMKSLVLQCKAKGENLSHTLAA